MWNTVTFCGVGVGKMPGVGFGLQSSPMCKVCSFVTEQKSGNTPVLIKALRARQEVPRGCEGPRSQTEMDTGMLPRPFHVGGLPPLLY